LLSDVDIHDATQLGEYIARTPAVIEAHGGRYLVRRGRVEIVEGTWRPTALVVVEFPSMEAARRWYASPEYQEVRTRCFRGATRDLVLVEGVEPVRELSAYPSWATETIRYGDTDRQGHVNNAVFATLLETGRVNILHSRERPVREPGSEFVIARLVIDFRAELSWPGEARVGTRVRSIGRSSAHLEQAIFQDGRCAATSESVIVLVDETTRKSRPLSADAVARLAELRPAR
jgi:acyl-CoA thioester hydrolase